MKTLQEQIIAKQDELIQNFKDWCRIKSIHDEELAKKIAKEAVKLESELSALKAQAEQVTDETLDLQQYVTNLLYYAHVEAMDMHSIDFDKWVEREVDNLAEYLNKEKVTDKDIHIEAQKKHYDSGLLAMGYEEGARDMRDGLITHNK